ncbi:hypothetical protein K7X08_006024 [Anisodus acutangulus]|uniref:60S ribosomal export protein NMD3 n=1 Tax=Anisodus acutangulus TaxID=402998 RepID=A0A9Q1R7R0_9SOLA|nr:hypothetical protein K7X08_006024 [Anisodus acutangulus]
MAQEMRMFTVHHTIGNVLFCKCGISMQPNAANMCANCLRSEVDITEGLQKHVIICHCPECDRYLQPPRTWIKAQLESKELLTFYAEVQKEVLHGAILEQAYTVEYVVQDQMCEACTRVQANPDQGVAAVQLRQHVSHRRTFFYLEQLILKHDAAARAIMIKQMDQGIDMFFSNRSHAVKFLEFIAKVVPSRSRNDKQLVSHDVKSSIYNYKYTFSVEICPVCREDLICLPPKVANSLGNLGPLVICTKVSNNIALLDPFTLRNCFLDAEQYWRSSFKSLLSSRQLVEYIVLDVEAVSSENDTIFNVRTHLGHLLNPGDYALGYDLFAAANNNDSELDKYKGFVLPDVILVKKSYEEKWQKKHGKPRSWKLKSLNMEIDENVKGRDYVEKNNSEYEQFLRDLEENPDLRFNISLYRNREYQPSEMASVTDGDDAPPPPFCPIGGIVS